MTEAPYGSWTSPISAADVAGSSHPTAGALYVGDEIWWLELRPTEGGRYAVRRRTEAGEIEDLLPPPWNVRTRVHEYGGGAWTVTAPVGDQPRAIVFAEFGDQRLYRHTPGGNADPQPLTPPPDEPAALRYAELQISRDGREVWCVRETHRGQDVTREFVAIPLDGSASRDTAAVRVIAGGSHFLAGLRQSPDGSQLAWIAWEHPQMPWDGTELRVASLGMDGTAGPARTLLGSTTESVLQPEWLDDATLYALSDRSGFWNLYRVPVDGSDPVNVAPVEAELGGPMWTLGSRWYAPQPDGTVLAVRTFGTSTLTRIDPRTGSTADVELAGVAAISLGAVNGHHVLLTTGGARIPRGVREVDLTTGHERDVRLDLDDLPEPVWFAEARTMSFTGPQGREVHAVVYPPTNPDFTAPDGERPPYVAHVHGGPTAQVMPALSLNTAYWTSRGIGIIDVNYGGSTGYGREYRDRLRGQWGVVDVEDTVTAVQGLADAGEADAQRLGIEGGSAGGWTVLSALTVSDAFACGVSYFGVAELIQFAAETHDFESRYLDGLIGSLPEDRDLYESRAPVNNVSGLSCPVLLLQGLDDPIVPPSQAERFVEALQNAHLPYAYRTYEGESHGFRKQETQIDALESSLSFYGQVLGFDPVGVPVLELVRP